MSRWTSKDNIARFKRIQRLLTKQPRTSAQLAQVMGLTINTIRLMMKEVRKDTYVIGWDQAITKNVAVWAWGVGEDVPRPPNKKARAVQQQEMKEDLQEAIRVYVYRPQPVMRDWSVSMLFGPALNLNAELAGMHP